ncbi:MAG: hypothetical protein AB7K37_02310 [Cyclobacteriaceae bacterium]
MRYLYKETSEKENSEISKALISDSELRAQYQDLLAVKKQLDGVQLEPSSSTVLNILSHARSQEEKLK